MAKKKQDCPKCLPGWLASFGDMMSLLLCFFVLLLSMSTMDAKKIEQAIGSLAGALSILDGGRRPEVSKTKNEQRIPSSKTDDMSDSRKIMQESVKDMNQMLKAANNQQIVVKDAENGFIIRLPASILFQKGSAELENEDGILFLRRIAMIMSKMPSHLIADVIGHTDDTPVSENSKFKSNWELSSARAVSVVEELLRNGVEPKRLMASGRAEFIPVASNLNEAGKEKNRRVEIYFHSMDENLKDETRKSVLDGASD